ncbi:hypothetical protein [Myxococcus xanthus]|uniref:Uncharacterized protein n=1 Tax=Myxococcus xanthus TaxID=34 RepID=A0A7Y4MS20_MYXXA|nr:hypothetical protein [Myxococcus xanthus]NOJ79063.1 hypothetical protein [Myxococcus xanthus]NOJ86016.1 hypothetical protein [Myxococcus xanthus]
MIRQEAAMFFGSLLLWVPLLLGAGVGRWRRKRAGDNAPAARLWAIVNLPGALVLLLACNGVMAPRTLAWFRSLGALPFAPTPGMLQGVAMFAAFVLGYSIASMMWSGPAQDASTASTNAPGTTGPVNKHSSMKVFAVICATIALSSGTGVVSQGLRKGGFLTTSDVGGLPELAQVQEQLRPLEACSITYRRRDKRGQRQHPNSVFIETCSVGEYIIVLIDVPGTWADKGVGFEMSRGSISEPWEIQVEKAEVPFPDLEKALEHFAPLIAAQYPEKLRERRASASEMERHLDEQQRLEQERKARAKGSYPR